LIGQKAAKAFDGHVVFGHIESFPHGILFRFLPLNQYGTKAIIVYGSKLITEK